MSDNKQTLIFSIAHRFDLVFFLRLIEESDIKEQYNIKVLFFAHNHFKDKLEIANNILSKISNDIVHIDHTLIPYYQKNIFKNIYLGLKMKKLLKMNFFKNEHILLLDKSHLHSNILFNFFNKPILFQFIDNSFNKRLYKERFFKTAAANIINFCLRNRFIKIFQLKNTTKVEHYETNMKYLSVIYINDTLNKDVKSINFSKPEISSCGKIVIFGARYLGWNVKKIFLTK